MIQIPDSYEQKFEFITLENKLEILLISDKDADKSACSMNVNVGQFSDGEFPGIAHFCNNLI
jgi:insulysin